MIAYVAFKFKSSEGVGYGNAKYRFSSEKPLYDEIIECAEDFKNQSDVEWAIVLNIIPTDDELYEEEETNETNSIQG